jgi:hypothetical protein
MQHEYVMFSGKIKKREMLILKNYDYDRTMTEMAPANFVLSAHR